MKKKIILTVILILLLIAGAFGFWLIFESQGNNEIIEEPADIPALIAENADTAFEFLSKENTLPDNMSGYVVDFATDINMSDTSETALKTAAEKVFEKVNAILPNTVVINYSQTINYSPNGFDVLSYLISVIHEKNMYAILLLSDDDFSAKKISTEKVSEIAEKYNIDGIMTEANELTPEITAKTSAIRAQLNSKNITFGLIVNDAPDTEAKAVAESGCIDFCFVKINSALNSGALDTITSWADIALNCSTKIYAILRNDLVKSDENWSDSDEIYNQLRAIYNYGGFSGCIMQSHAKLSSNDNDITSDIYFYNEYFNDVDFTALTITSFTIKDNNSVIIEGTSEKEFPVHTWCTDLNSWQTVQGQGDDGSFRSELMLGDGENKIIIKHKNAMYTYFIDRVVDVMTAQSAVIDNKTVTLTATAVKGAKVWASVANTQTIELTADGNSNEKYITYTATYELPEKYALLKPEQVSFAATYCGIDDIVMCGKTKELSPYDDHGLGTTTMCRVTKNFAETTSAASADDTSDPTCTPQLEDAYAHVYNCTVKDNIVVYETDAGMKIHGEHAKLILDAYKMPSNSVHIDSIKNDDKTVLTFSFDYLPFIKTVIEPQEYYADALEKTYTVKEFTGEYIDIIFTNTSECSYTEEPNFSASNVISKAEWYSDSEAGTMTLRLYFKTKADFAGYSLYKNENGSVSISLKKTADSLSGTVIMLDPGHGGYGAPGTYSATTVYEHEVVKNIADKTAEILREHGATVIMTRGNDESLSLSERVDMTRTTDPDIFVSIHCDGSENESWFGTHTFYYKNYSMPLASAIHEQMVNAYRTYVYTDPTSDKYSKADMDCKFFPYMVTRVEECPSVLVECGYLTNYTDAIFLTDDAGQQVTAMAIAQGIVDYIAGS